MKKFRFGVPLLLVFLLAGSVYYMINSRYAVADEYQEKLRQAREAVKNGVLTDGIALYREVLSIRPSVELYTEAGNVYLDSDDLQGAHRWYEREFVTQYPNEPETYEYGIRASLADQDCRQAFEIYDLCTKREAVSESVEELIKPVWYSYELLFGHYDETGPFSSQNGYAAVKIKDRWGYVNQDGSLELQALYQSADVFGDYAAVTDMDGEAYYIDASGNTRITAAQFTDEHGDPAGIQMFRPVMDGVALAFDGETWSYYDLKTYKKLSGGYTDAYVTANGTGAVAKGEKAWALTGSGGQELTGYDYEEVIANSRGIVCCTGALFVKQDGKYWLADPKGSRISDSAYDKADGFNGDGPAAVQKNGKWIFVNSAGEETDLGEFQEAKSFSNGLAAVKKGGRWGYIDQDGNQAIDCVFYDADDFNGAGVAFVKASEYEWTALSLYRFHFH